MGNPDYPAVFSQPSLVGANHQGDFTMLLQNCGDVDLEIPRCTAIGLMENLKNDTFKKMYVVDAKKMEQVSKDKPIPKPMPN